MVSRWLPLYLVGIAALTLFPFTAPSCPPAGWIFRMGTLDSLANLLAFLPIGLALRRSTLPRTVALALALSLTIEFCQQWLPRQQDLTDLLSNTGGAALGWWLARLWRARWSGPLFRPVTRTLMLRSAALLFVGLVSIEAATRPGHDFSTWQPFPIVIGNSAYGDRPWMGAISELALYDRALDAEAGVQRLEPGDAPALWAEGGPILWLRFTGGEPIGRVDGPGGPIAFAPHIGDTTYLSTSGVNLMPSGVRLDPWISDHVVDHMRERNQLTLDLRLRAHVLRQHGPSRILSMGDGGRLRNFALAQRSQSFVAWLRTPSNGESGTRMDVRTKNTAVTGEEQRLRFRYDGAEGVLWVDGVCADDSAIAIGTAPWLVGSVLGLSIAGCPALAALALASLARGRAARVLLAVLGGATTWLLLDQLGAWSHLPDFDTWALLLGLASVSATLPVLLKPRPVPPSR